MAEVGLLLMLGEFLEWRALRCSELVWPGVTFGRRDLRLVPLFHFKQSWGQTHPNFGSTKPIRSLAMATQETPTNL